MYCFSMTFPALGFGERVPASSYAWLAKVNDERRENHREDETAGGLSLDELMAVRDAS